MWLALVLVAIAGAIGSLANALCAAPHMMLPRLRDLNGATVLVPGFLGNLLVGAVAAVVSYGLYGPMAVVPLLHQPDPADPAAKALVRLTLASFVGAILVGYAGGRWISAEADKRLNHATAVRTAELLESVRGSQRAPSSPRPAEVITPAEARETGETLLKSLSADNALEAYRQADRAFDASDPGEGDRK